MGDSKGSWSHGKPMPPVLPLGSVLTTYVLQVPIDKPYEAHDILLRFTGIDTLNAAGAGSKVPSTVGNGNGNVLGKISPEGETLESVKDELEKQAAAVDKAASDAVDKAGAEGQPVDKDRELVYGPRRSAVLFLIVLTVALSIYGLLRWRIRRRHQRKGWIPKHAENKHYFLARSESGYRLGRLGISPPPGSSIYHSRRVRHFSTENSPATSLRTPIAKDGSSGYDRFNPRPAPEKKRTQRDSMDETARVIFSLEDEEDEESRDNDGNDTERK